MANFLTSSRNSPFTKLLASNHAASGAEVQHIGEILLEQDKDLAGIDREIFRARDFLNQLVHDRDEISKSRLAHLGLLHPARRTPPEVWGEIFVHCLPTEEFVQIDMLGAPLLLTRVCSSWRLIALSTPRLWKSIAIGGFMKAIQLSYLPLIQAWLRRSGYLRLSVQIYHCEHRQPWRPDATETSVFHSPASSSGNPYDHTSHTFVPPPHDHPTNILEKLLDVFLPFSSRWHNLLLHLPHPLIARLIGNNDIALPSLTALNITISGPTMGAEPLKIPESATNLHRVVFFASNLRTDAYIFPWAQLTTLSTFGYLHIYECIEIFYLCPNLSSLSLSDIQGSLVEEQHSNSRALLPNLTYLSLSLWQDGAALLDYLILPSLQEAELSFHSLVSLKPELTSIISMFRRSSCPLHMLYLWGKYFLEEDVVELVQRVPTVQDLEVQYNGKHYVSDQVSKILAQRVANKVRHG